MRFWDALQAQPPGWKRNVAITTELDIPVSANKVQTEKDPYIQQKK
jgi:hypothetical protein